MVGFRDLVGTGIAPVSTKTAVKRRRRKKKKNNYKRWRKKEKK